ncbi:MAG: AAA family ATPase, partial [Cyanobacteria bacterium NC_groundwater_1444_Ag_S-0.65um_54_12]|nr:AAA family ATPase [Cyanobacteria bacterium NC_groundwater_1444_Ag_S-0.65um_54_12]
VKFAGDALLAIWPADSLCEHDLAIAKPASTSDELALALARAAQCALALHEATAARPLNLALRVVVGAGRLVLAHLGGVYGRWEIVLAGEALVGMSSALAAARPGQTVFTPAAHGIAPSCYSLQELTNAIWALESIKMPVATTTRTKLVLPSEAEPALRCYLPGAIRHRLVADQLVWLSELRQCTILFVHLPGLALNLELAFAQEIMQALQTALYRFEGSINKLSVDDKGISLLAALGLPPLSHEDDALRGIRAALAIRDCLADFAMHCAIGVATGRIFCGEVGNAWRREYAVIGDTVNLAARLMQAAAKDGIICDSVTYHACRERIVFAALPDLKLKGKSQPVPVYQPCKESEAQRPQASAMVGREAERQLLCERLDQLLVAGKGGKLVIEGEAGVGKSLLLAELERESTRRGASYLEGAGDAVEKSTPLFAWRPVFAQIFNIEQFANDPVKRTAHVLSLLGEEPELLEYAPLLSTILPIAIPDNELTAALEGSCCSSVAELLNCSSVRMEHSYGLLAKLLAKISKRSPLVIAIEDAHWLDSASWTLLLRVARASDHLLLVIVLRPPGNPPPVEYQEILHSGAQRLSLGLLAPDEAIALVCRRLSVSSVPELVARLIQERAGGHPFFSEEIAHVLQEQGIITVANGKCQLAPAAGDLRNLALPSTVQGAIMSRIDRLAPGEQLALKVASVIGRVFAFRTLHDIFPVADIRLELSRHLNELEQFDLTHLEAKEPELAYGFKHVITQEVAYQLMLFSQRSEMHQRVAKWYEAAYADDLTPYLPLLAYHWLQAGKKAQAIKYLELAGDQAMRTFAFPEALGFFSRVLALAPEAPAARRAHWEQQSGRALSGLGRMNDSRPHFERALQLLGLPLPANNIVAGLSFLKETFSWLCYWALFRSGKLKPAIVSETELERLRQLTGVYLAVQDIYYYLNDANRGGLAMIRAAWLAERLGPSPELGRAYVMLAILATYTPFAKLVETYVTAARHAVVDMDPWTKAYVHSRCAMASLSLRNWDDVRSDCETAIATFDRLSDWRLANEARHWLALLAWHTGDWERTIALSGQICEAALARDDVQAQLMGLLLTAQYHLHKGKIAAALASLKQAEPLVESSQDRINAVWHRGLVAQANLVIGCTDEARSAVLLAGQLAISCGGRILSPDNLLPTAEVALELWELDMQTAGNKARSDNNDLKKLCYWACNQLRQINRTTQFSILKADSMRMSGKLAWLNGRTARSERLWRKAITIARDLGLPYQEGLANLEIARHLSRSHPDQHIAHGCASEIFSQLGAEMALAQLAGL